MATIPSKYVNPGDVAREAQTNTAYSAVATGTASLNDENTRSEWVSRQHISNTVPVTTNPFKLATSTASMVYNPLNTNYAPIVLGGTPMAVSPVPYDSVGVGEVMRVHFDINVDDWTYTPPAAGYINAANPQDCYGFTLYWDIGAGLVQCPWSPDATYSVSMLTSVNPGAPYNTQTVPATTTRYRKRQRCNLTAIYINTGPNPVSILTIQARVKVYNTGSMPMLTLDSGELCAVFGRR